jgi:acetate CoA/acetoacetate CoA-transferase alpha subunit
MRTIKPMPVADAVDGIRNGSTLMIGGFMAVGTPERIIDEIVRQKKRGLRVIANDTATPEKGIGKLIGAGLVDELVVSHIGLNPQAQQKMLGGALRIELVPQGTLIERIRAGGFGLGGVLTRTGVGTLVEEGKRRIEIDGVDYLLEMPLKADIALVHAFLSDYVGNLSYALTQRNFNPVIATAADRVIVSAEHIVPVGVIAPDHVVTPGALVDCLVANA